MEAVKEMRNEKHEELEHFKKSVSGSIFSWRKLSRRGLQK